jgi:formylglycine-generating enzyme required for sulfatase activity
MIVLTLPALAGDTGYLQVNCAPGVQIFLDYKLKGVTNAEQGGLIIENVSSGRYGLRVVKSGFQPQVYTVTVIADQVVEVEVKPYIPKVKIIQEGEEQLVEMKLKVGSLQIHSLPIECSLSINTLGVNKQAKTKDQWRAEHVPVGKYTIVANSNGESLSHQVEVYENTTAKVFFNFMTGDINDIGAARRAKELASARRCEQKMQVVRAEALELGIKFPANWSFVQIKPGKFRMGSPIGETGREDDEKAHEVILTKTFWMGSHEVTNGSYQRFLKETGSGGSKEADDYDLRHHNDWLKFISTDSEHPIVAVTWHNAVAFCNWLTSTERRIGHLPEGYEYRLPTEAEWEYAARGGGSGRSSIYSGIYSGSHRIDDVAWYNDNSDARTHPVGQKQANELGLYDMTGNVWEWCLDWKGAYSEGLQTDPVGPSTGSSRVNRGGSWNDDMSDCRVANRSEDSPMFTHPLVGFRVVLASRFVDDALFPSPGQSHVENFDENCKKKNASIRRKAERGRVLQK